MIQKATNNFITNLKKQKRDDSSLLFLDNIKIINDALKSGLKAKYILIDNEDLNYFEKYNVPVYKTDRKTIEMLSDSKTPQGVVCIIEYIQNIVEKPTTNFLVLDGLQDPGNVGTLIRTATACGFESVFLLSSVKVTNPKMIRSSAGTIFQNKVMSITKEDFVKLAKEWKLNLIATDMNGENIFKFKPHGNIGLIIGNEGQGISDEIMSLCNHIVKIPMKDGVESLNASISGAIIMYQLTKDNF